MIRRWRSGIGGGIAAILVTTALLAQTSITSNASWNDSEWVRAPSVGTITCADPAGAFANRSEGRMLSGSLLGFNLDALAQANGVEVTNNAQRSKETAGTATALGDDAWANPLNVQALSAVNVNLGQGVLQLPLNNSLGALGQYARTPRSGAAHAAAGYVTNTGGIAAAPGNAYPDLATLQLSQLINAASPGLGSSLGGITDARLRIGAVTGRASLDGCRAAWNTNLSQSLTREYLAAGLRTEFTSPAVGALTSGVSGTVGTLQSTVNQLGSNSSVLLSIKNGATQLVNGVLGATSGLGVRIGSVNVSNLTASINLTPVQTLLTQPFSDPEGVVSINPSNAQISIDTGALLAAAYPGSYGNKLNNLPPNTSLLADAAVLSKLGSAASSALDAWIGRVNTALSSAIDAVQLSVKVEVNLELEVCVVLVGCSYVPLAKVTATTSGTLTSLTTTTSLQVLGVGLLTPVLDALLGNVVAALVNGLGGVVNGAVSTALSGLRVLPPAVTTLLAPVLTEFSTLYSALYSATGLVAITVNAQNDPLTGAAEPTEWASGVPPGRYDVAALRLSVLDSLPLGARLYLGRASVGRACSPAQLGANACTGY